MTRVLIYEDEYVRRYDVYDDEGNHVGTDEESKAPPEEACPTCGRSY